MQLREYLQKNGITVRAFARSIGRSETTIQNIMKGYNTDLDTAITIEDATNRKVKCRELGSKAIRPRKSHGIAVADSSQTPKKDDAHE